MTGEQDMSHTFHNVFAGCAQPSKFPPPSAANPKMAELTGIVWWYPDVMPEPGFKPVRCCGLKRVAVMGEPEHDEGY